MVEPNTLFFSVPERSRDLCVVTHRVMSHPGQHWLFLLHILTSWVLCSCLAPGQGSISEALPS